MIRIAVCDDIPCVAEAIRRLLAAHDFGEETEVDCFSSGEELYLRFARKKYEILVTDIELAPDGYSDKLMKNGMLLADELKEMYPETIVIFLSRYNYERDLLRHEPFGFVDKPNIMGDERITEIVGKAVEKLRNRAEHEKVFWFKKGGIWLKKEIREIMYFESSRPRIRLAAVDEECTFRGRLDQVQEKIEKSAEKFIRVSKSYYINTGYIKCYTSREVTMADGMVVPVSRKYLEEFRRKVSPPC